MHAMTMGLPTVSRQLAMACSLVSADAAPPVVIKAKAAIKAATGARANGFEPTREKAEVLNEPGMK
jgi:hypothetical protein